MLQNILLQVPAAAGIDSTLTASSTSINYFELLLKGGFVVYPILILLFVTFFLMAERYLFIKKSSKIDFGFLRSLKDNILRGDMRSAIAMCKSTNLPISRILEKGIARIGRPVKDIESAMEIQSNLEISKMEKNMGYLGLIAGVAPTLGFVGTISGIIRIFYEISVTGEFSIETISNGLYEKMIASFSGLVVGLIAYSAYHGINMMIDKFSIHLQATVMDFLDTLNEPAS
ncbi:MotA/TolQ/ExbB proton channel family protein [Jiulongibacter sediminis]|uniref:Biopolymer transporter ExbB n=1 Tax=Jiulongibacter sediminis TaxID=1605367 RepID=A0A0P7C5M2_9BACT|nr:MotA/TolQ/ExbB proton channel family protein [Jiulongibacter sediminis]KPM47471.1 biopolymer transporter ExbB [Jiulongibacter sediminis]TBX23266.1 biopolymer transporter ExbB [Jiulongibacter sediminis]